MGPKTAVIDISALAGNQPNVMVRFHYYNGSWSWWWQVDDVLIGGASSCTAPSGGLVVGNVYNANMTAGVNGATVSNEDSYTTNSAATPLDPNVDDGFYTLYSPAGSRTFTAVATGYTSDVDTVNVVANNTVYHDFSLGSALLSYAPESLAVTIPTGSSLIRPFTITNSGTDTANYQIGEIGGSVSDVAQDGSFEGGTPNTSWSEASTNFGTPICDSGCGADVSRTGSYWVWFGGANSTEIGSVDQTVTIPSGVTTLSFWLLIGSTGAPAFMNVSMDGDVLFSVTEADAASYGDYKEATVDVSAYADGGAHNLRFSSTEYGTSLAVTNFHVDDVSLLVDAGLPWLSELPASGTVAAATDQQINVTFDATAMTPGQYTGEPFIAHDTPSTVPNMPITTTVVTDYAWNGSQSSAWNNALNWTPNGVPNGFARVLVDPAYLTGVDWPVLEMDPAVFDLTVAAGAELTIPDGRSLAINGASPTTARCARPSTSPIPLTPASCISPAAVGQNTTA
ncbi:MAG: hypothetical protein IPM39_11685 [Chloroflexi bacterium]|nr:hypothetical protein [Chloroflexota bacterium]